MFLGKYKLMLGSDCRLIYGTTDYHRKRLKVLESERYIRRVNRLYIKLDDKGTRLVKEFGYDYSYKCRRKEYVDRLNEIAKVAALTLDSNIDFIASWNIKDDDIKIDWKKFDNEPIKENVKVFELKEAYKIHETMEVKDILEKRMTYVSSQRKEIIDLMKKANLTITEQHLKELIYGKEITQEYYKTMPLEKMKHDIFKKLRVY